MKSAVLLLAVALVQSVVCREYEDIWHWGTFPDDFMWACATSDYQVEGAWNVDGKGNGTWDTWVREEGNIADGTTGDVACNSYYQYMDDVTLMKNMGVTHYRFGLSWPRIMPNGRGEVNPLGIRYYKNLIAALKLAGIQPLVTLFHWNTPQALEDVGGWLNPDIIDDFAAYARVCFEEFGDDVKHWITFNEPWCTTYLGYGAKAKAPGRNSPAEEPYITGHNLLLAHAKAWHLYDDEFRPTQQGEVGITLNIAWYEPMDPDNITHVEASERKTQFDLGWFANPIFGEGDYPQLMRDIVAAKSAAQGYPKSRLPEFTPEQIEYIKGTSDFFGLNYYSAWLVYPVQNPLFPADYGADPDVGQEPDPNWLGSGSSWIYVTPWGIRKMINWISERYDHPRILITENGVTDRNGSLADKHRIFYLKHYINNVLQAIDLDNNRVIGYTAWSLMDNMEWEMGYEERFGLHFVNISDPTRTRIPKESSRFYSQVIADNGFPDPDSK